MDGNTRSCPTRAERRVVTPEVLESGVTLGSCAPFASGAKECGTQLQAQEPIDCAENGSGLMARRVPDRHAQILETLRLIVAEACATRPAYVFSRSTAH